jgi:hypothetical protein
VRPVSDDQLESGIEAVSTWSAPTAADGISSATAGLLDPVLGEISAKAVSCSFALAMAAGSALSPLCATPGAERAAAKATETKAVERTIRITLNSLGLFHRLTLLTGCGENVAGTGIKDVPCM